MKTEKSRLLIYAAIAAIIAVLANFTAASLLLTTTSRSWLIFSALGVGAALLAAYIALMAAKKQSLEVSKNKVRLYLGYADEDEQRVEELYKRLQAEGFEPWMDTKRLSAGENWVNGIERAIEDSDFVVVLISKNSLDKRGFLRKEIKFVLDLLDQKPRRKISVIPALLDNAKMPEPLTRFQTVNLFDDHGFSDLISALQINSEEGEQQSAS